MATPPIPPPECMSAVTPPEHYLIEVRAAGPGPIMPVRIRRFLKHGLRACALRCVKCYQLPAEEDHHEIPH